MTTTINHPSNPNWYAQAYESIDSDAAEAIERRYEATDINPQEVVDALRTATGYLAGQAHTAEWEHKFAIASGDAVAQEYAELMADTTCMAPRIVWFARRAGSILTPSMHPKTDRYGLDLGTTFQAGRWDGDAAVDTMAGRLSIEAETAHPNMHLNLYLRRQKAQLKYLFTPLPSASREHENDPMQFGIVRRRRAAADVAFSDSRTDKPVPGAQIVKESHGLVVIQAAPTDLQAPLTQIESVNDKVVMREPDRASNIAGRLFEIDIQQKPHTLVTQPLMVRYLVMTPKPGTTSS